jgi:hypothetical protein
MATTGNNGTIPLPNPFTPLAFLPPAIADKYQAVIYVYVATMAVSNPFRIFLREAQFSDRRSHGTG